MKPLPILLVAGAVMTAGLALTRMQDPEPIAAPAIALPEAELDAAPIVLELFTSQSCSSCPPADALAQQLATRDDLVVISRPVTYWNRIGWHDTFSSEANTDLQRAYAGRGLAGKNGVYTPQAVVNGNGGVVGSDSGDVAGLIASAFETARPSLTITADGVLVDGPDNRGVQAQLVVVAVDASGTVAIGSGENRDRTVTYTNIWLGETAIGEWAGGAQTFALPEALPDQTTADRHAVILREVRSDGAGAILGGRWLDDVAA